MAVDAVPYPAFVDTESMRVALADADIAAVGREMWNHFEDVLQIDAVTALRRRMLAAGALGACMTGSGSAVVGIFASLTAAEQCAQALRPLCELATVCRPWRRGPQVLTKK